MTTRNNDSVSGPTTSKSCFRSLFEEASKKRFQASPGDLDAAQRFRYVFVAGFHNEVMPGYFRENARELRSWGVPKRSIHFIYPGSHDDLVAGAGLLGSGLQQIARTGPERLVVIAHSRGACVTLAAALGAPTWFRDHCEHLFLLQGPFGGTLLADLAVGGQRSLSRSIPWKHRVTTATIATLERIVVRCGFDQGLHDLTRESSRRFWDSLLLRSSSSVPVISPLVYFLVSAIDPDRLRYPRSSLGWFLQDCLGRNDGVVCLGDQSLPGLGSCLPALDAGHTDLTWGVFPNHGAKNHRGALIQCLLTVVSSPGNFETRRQNSSP